MFLVSVGIASFDLLSIFVFMLLSIISVGTFDAWNVRLNVLYRLHVRALSFFGIGIMKLFVKSLGTWSLLYIVDIIMWRVFQFLKIVLKLFIYYIIECVPHNTTITFLHQCRSILTKKILIHKYLDKHVLSEMKLQGMKIGKSLKLAEWKSIDGPEEY